ncbi:MAG TPA: gamma-glutamyltransferase [Solirubrobacteraceae bacterium]
MRRALLLLLTVAAAALPATAQAKQATATGRGGAVASDSETATQAGLAVLRHGGTAADAAVAVASTLGVTDPLVAGIGGGGYFVYYDARTHRVYTIDGRETAPAADNQNLFIDPSTGKPYDFPTAVTSGLSVGVPGTLATWQEALSHWGRFALRADLIPAEAAAARGFELTPAVREEIRENAFRFVDFSSTKSLFLPGGKLPAAGTVMKNPDLARTYREIGRQGIGALYGGRIGADVVNTVQHLPLAPGAQLTPRPGAMTLSDLSDYKAIPRDPTHVTFNGYDVYGMPPSSSGGSTVGESLNILSNFDLRHESAVEQWHHFLESTRLAFADRNRYVGDSAFENVPLGQLLSPDFGGQRACLINPNQALTSPVAPGDPYAGSGGCTPTQPTSAGQTHDGASTNHFVVADRRGDVVSYTNTIEELGGSGIVVPGRGFLLNNELTDFDFTPVQPGVHDPNLPAAGKRPRSSMSPTIVLRHGRPFLAVGAAGGATIITTVLQILVDRLEFGQSLPAAIAAPRASQRNSSTTQAEPAFLQLPVVKGLEALGQKFSVTDTSPLNPNIKIAPTIGVASGLEVLGPDRFLAAAEPERRGGGAAGVLDSRRRGHRRH